MGAGEDIATKGLLGRGLKKGMLGGMLGLVAAGCFLERGVLGKGMFNLKWKSKFSYF